MARRRIKPSNFLAVVDVDAMMIDTHRIGVIEVQGVRYVGLQVNGGTCVCLPIESAIVVADHLLRCAEHLSAIEAEAAAAQPERATFAN